MKYISFDQTKKKKGYYMKYFQLISIFTEIENEINQIQKVLVE